MGLLTLAAKLVLPAAHQLEIGAHDRVAALARASTDASHAAWRATSHDPASCPVCCSLRASSATAGSTAYAQPLDGLAALPVTSPPRAEGSSTRDAHPPRAPPASSFVV